MVFAGYKLDTWPVFIYLYQKAKTIYSILFYNISTSVFTTALTNTWQLFKVQYWISHQHSADRVVSTAMIAVLWRYMKCHCMCYFLWLQCTAGQWQESIALHCCATELLSLQLMSIRLRFHLKKHWVRLVVSMCSYLLVKLSNFIFSSLFFWALSNCYKNKGNFNLRLILNKFHLYFMMIIYILDVTIFCYSAPHFISWWKIAASKNLLGI